MKQYIIDGRIYSLRDCRDDEISRKDGIYCSKCNSIKVTGYEGIILEANLCECDRAKIRAEEEYRAKVLRVAKINDLKKQSLLHDRYNNALFEKSEPLPQHRKLKEYADAAARNYTNGTSLYLNGKCGTGKTHSMACVANVLMDKLYSVHFTNFNNIVRDIKSTFNSRSKRSEQDIFEVLTDVDFLFIDDIGTEYIKDKDGYIQSIIYDVINTRYNKYKPCVFSSNYSIIDLCGLSNIEERTGQRIYEMTKGNVIEFNGRNFRI